MPHMRPVSERCRCCRCASQLLRSARTRKLGRRWGVKRGHAPMWCLDYERARPLGAELQVRSIHKCGSLRRLYPHCYASLPQCLCCKGRVGLWEASVSNAPHPLEQ
eukprot:scaffold39925_cov33-Phaeocystis_antarctica.AAC.2